jgi:multidrug transporter EmrE-like cation transporter
MQLHELIGTLGAALIVVTYLLIQLRRIDVSDVRYSVLNATGAALILYSLTVDFNLSAFVIEIFWLLISLLGIIQVLRERSRRRQSL